MPANGTINIDPAGNWHCGFSLADIRVRVTIRVGVELYDYFGGNEKAFVEVCAALIRACIAPTKTEPADYKFTIVDLPEIISLESVPSGYNVAILQRSQLEWLFFMARHFCDDLVDVDLTEGI